MSSRRIVSTGELPLQSTVVARSVAVGMFTQADVVKAVMIGLAFASLVTWTIWLARGVELAASRRRAQSCVRKLMRADSLGAARRDRGEVDRQGPGVRSDG